MSSMLSPGIAQARAEELRTLKENWFLFFLLGLISAIVGFLALGSTFIATLASVKVFGILLLIAGGAEVAHAILARNGRGLALHLLSAALYLLVGLFILEDPIEAAKVITLILAASFLVGGVLRIIFAIALRFPAWPWVMFNGFVNLALGVMIWNRWPEASLWVIGMFVGIDLLLHGWTWMIMALGVRTMSVPTAN